MTRKTVVYGLIDAAVIALTIVLTRFLTRCVAGLGIAYVSTVVPIALYILCAVIDLIIFFVFLYFWRCENKWKRMKERHPFLKKL